MKIKKLIKGLICITMMITSGLALTPKVKTQAETIPSVSYRTHVQTYGWQSYKNDGAMSGTQGQSKRLEGINIKLSDTSQGLIQYRTHVQTYGWQNWVSNGAMSGTQGQSKRLEAIQIKLTGELANKYDVVYQVHIQRFGWSGWAKNGQSCGSASYGFRLEGIRVKIIPKDTAFGTTTNHYYSRHVKYRTHVQDYGWQSSKFSGETSGTSGLGKRLEGINISLNDLISVNDKSYADSGITYRTHIQTYGWQNWVSNDAMSGTQGQSKRLEAIQIKLTGSIANDYDVIYRVHSQRFGWLSWAKNGEYSGTQGFSFRLEAIQIKLVEKGSVATNQVTAFKQKTSITASDLSIYKGSSKTINANTTSILGNNFTYKSNNTSIAQVASNGVVIGLQEGKTSVEISDGYSTKTISINVVPNVVIIAGGDREFSTEKIGQSIKFTASCTNNSPIVMWNTSDYNVISIDVDGTAKINGAGSCVISASSQDGIVGKITVSVKEPYLKWSDGTTAQKSGSVDKGSSKTLSVSSNAEVVSWTVDDPNTAKLNSTTGKSISVTGLKTGGITLTSDDGTGYSRNCVTKLNPIVTIQAKLNNGTTLTYKLTITQPKLKIASSGKVSSIKDYIGCVYIGSGYVTYDRFVKYYSLISGLDASESKYTYPYVASGSFFYLSDKTRAEFDADGWLSKAITDIEISIRNSGDTDKINCFDNLVSEYCYGGEIQTTYRGVTYKTAYEALKVMLNR